MEQTALTRFDNKLLDGLAFCRLVYDYFEQVRQSEGGVRTLRARPRPVKRLLEELLPIARYVQAHYGPGKYLSIRWMNGNQQFDAQVETTGAYVDNTGWPASSTIEVTHAVHENDHLMREKLNSEGAVFGLDGISRVIAEDGSKQVASVPVSYTNRSYIQDMQKIVVAAIQAKVSKSYPKHTALIVDCSLITLFLRDEWETLVTLIRADMPKHEFMEIYLTAGQVGYAAFL